MKSSPRTPILSVIAAVALLGACSKQGSMSANSANDTSSSTAATSGTNTSTNNATASNATAATPAATSNAAGGSTAAATSSSDQGRAVQLTANDTMKYDTTEIHAKPGETLTVTFKNVGTLPKTAMGHNFIVLKSQDLVQPFITDAAQAGATDYIPSNHDNDIIAHTKLLGPGESDTVTFKAPEKPGHYPYFCSFPGHYAVGMKGELIVE